MKTSEIQEKNKMNAFGGMFAAAGYHAAVQADPYGRMAGVHAGLQDPTATAAAALMHHHWYHSGAQVMVQQVAPKQILS